jgi:hypothetical protein
LGKKFIVELLIGGLNYRLFINFLPYWGLKKNSLEKDFYYTIIN